MESESCFYGELCDETSVIPLVALDKHHRDTLDVYLKKKTQVTIKNCQIASNKTTGRPQVIIKSYTVLEAANCKDQTLHILDPNTIGSPITSIKELHTIEEYGRLTLQVAVIKVDESRRVSTGKVKQELTVADETDNTILTLWEQDIDMLENGKSYQLNRVQMHTYSGKYII